MDSITAGAFKVTGSVVFRYLKAGMVIWRFF